MIACLLVLFLFLFSPKLAHAANYSVSTDQELTNTTRSLKPGDTLTLKSGTYRSQLYTSTSINGTVDQIITIKAETGATVIFDGSNITAPCVRLQGSYILVSGITASNCYSHGVLIQGKNITFENSVVKDSVKENQATPHVKWGSGLKVAYGGEDVILRNNTVYHNWGEGIAVTRGRRVKVENNHIYDNFSVNLYIDNSSQVTAHDNFITCKPNTGFERDGRRANGISISEEAYDGWGSQLTELTITNNIVAYCHRGVSFYSSEVSNGGLRSSTISGNTLWDSQDYTLYINSFPQTQNSSVTKNIIYNAAGKVARVPSTTGLTFNQNTWLGGKPASNLQSSNDVFIVPDWLTSPDYTKQSFLPTTPTASPLPSPSSSPSPSPSPAPTITPQPSPTSNPSPSPTPTLNPRKPIKKHSLISSLEWLLAAISTVTQRYFS